MLDAMRVVQFLTSHNQLAMSIPKTTEIPVKLRGHSDVL